MNTTAIALVTRILGAILFIIGLIATSYTTTVPLPSGCVWLCSIPGGTVTPYVTYGIVLAVIALGMLWLGYFVLPIEDETNQSSSLVPSGTTAPPTDF